MGVRGFCQIVAGWAPADVVYEGERTLGFLDIRPANPSHTLVVPKRDVEDVHTLDDADAGAVMSTVRRASLAIRETLAPDGLLPPRHAIPYRDDDLAATADRVRQAIQELN
jgi:histidine triad (HIT) family protein